MYKYELRYVTSDMVEHVADPIYDNVYLETAREEYTNIFRTKFNGTIRLRDADFDLLYAEILNNVFILDASLWYNDVKRYDLKMLLTGTLNVREKVIDVSAKIIDDFNDFFEYWEENERLTVSKYGSTATVTGLQSRTMFTSVYNESMVPPTAKNNWVFYQSTNHGGTVEHEFRKQVIPFSQPGFIADWMQADAGDEQFPTYPFYSKASVSSEEVSGDIEGFYTLSEIFETYLTSIGSSLPTSASFWQGVVVEELLVANRKKLSNQVLLPDESVLPYYMPMKGFLRMLNTLYGMYLDFDGGFCFKHHTAIFNNAPAPADTANFLNNYKGIDWTVDRSFSYEDDNLPTKEIINTENSEVDGFSGDWPGEIIRYDIRREKELKIEYDLRFLNNDLESILYDWNDQFGEGILIASCIDDGTNTIANATSLYGSYTLINGDAAIRNIQEYRMKQAGRFFPNGYFGDDAKVFTNTKKIKNMATYKAPVRLFSLNTAKMVVTSLGSGEIESFKEYLDTKYSEIQIVF